MAEDMNRAVDAYTIYHPLQDGFIPCAGVYEKEEFKKTTMYKNGNYGYKCREAIVLMRMQEE